MVRSEVSAARITSASFISGTGLKKCMPAIRSRFPQALAIEAIGIDEVLDAMTQSGWTDRFDLSKERLLDVEILGDRLDDHIAIGKRTHGGDRLKSIRRHIGLSLIQLFFLDESGEPPLDPLRCAEGRLIVGIQKQRSNPALDCHLRDPLPHGASTGNTETAIDAIQRCHQPSLLTS